MRITKGAFYRHKSSLDMDIEVVSILELGTNYVKLKVRFVSSRDHNLMFWPECTTIKILSKDYPMWDEVEM